MVAVTNVMQNEYRSRIETLERELEVSKSAKPQVLSQKPNDRQQILALYSMVCALADSDRSTPGNRYLPARMHPPVDAFETCDDLMKYIARLVGHDNANLAVDYVNWDGMPHDVSESNAPTPLSRADTAPPREASSESTTTPPASKRPTKGRVLSVEEEAEFRAIARLLVSTGALDAYVPSSSEDESVEDEPFSQLNI